MITHVFQKHQDREREGKTKELHRWRLLRTSNYLMQCQVLDWTLKQNEDIVGKPMNLKVFNLVNCADTKLDLSTVVMQCENKGS
jgi:hypothetical protein